MTNSTLPLNPLSEASNSPATAFFTVSIADHQGGVTSVTLEATGLVDAILFIKETLPGSDVLGAYRLLERAA
jgi:hypothetical protein